MDRRKYTPQEKNQLLANLDIEVEHKVRQFEAWLADTLENFQIHQEGQISRVPKLVRGLTMREFGEKYGGDVQAALMGLQRDKMPAGVGGENEIDKTTRKRKWVASQEGDGEKSVKNPRMMSPKKKPGSSTGPGTAQRARMIAANRTPGTSRTMGRVPPSPSPTKPRQLPRPASPMKGHSQPLNQIHPHPNRNANRPPSSTTFNPFLPPKTPGFPTRTNSNPTLNGPGTMRAPRRHESMLSVNGSPLANPYELGLEWFAEGGDASDSGEDEKPRANGRKNSIAVRRDPSFSFQSAPLPNGKGQRPGHSRTPSQTSTKPLPPNSSQTTVEEPIKPPATKSAFTFGKAFVTIPTKDGHLLEFDPLQTSPGTLDALPGISDSAKKAAKEEMGRLVRAAVSKWAI